METEATILQAARLMDKDALVRIFDLYSSALYNYALRLYGDPVFADHIVGDVFAKLLNQLSSGNGPTANLRSYLFETAYHGIIDEVRHSRRQVQIEVLDVLTQDGNSVFLPLEDQILYTQVVYAIRNELTDDQRHVMILRFLEQFSLRETAAILGKKVEHVKVIQSRAIAKLRRSLKYKIMTNALPYSGSRNVPNTLGV